MWQYLVINDKSYGYPIFHYADSMIAGADTPLFLAVLPENEQTMRGKFASERKIVKWE